MTEERSGRAFAGRRRVPRRGLVVVAVSLVAVLVAGGSSASTGKPSIDELSGKPSIDDLLEHPDITRGKGLEIRVDVSKDPEGVERAFAAAGDALDGHTFYFDGGEVNPPGERRAADAHASRFDAKPSATDCTGANSPARSKNGSTTPYFGCDRSSEVGAAVNAKHGRPESSLSAALDQVAVHYLGPDARGIANVQVKDGVAIVDFSPVLEALAQNVDSRELREFDNALHFTARSNGSITHIEFAIAGDCLAYAVFTGGDTCSLVALDEIPVS